MVDVIFCLPRAQGTGLVLCRAVCISKCAPHTGTVGAGSGPRRYSLVRGPRPGDAVSCLCSPAWAWISKEHLPLPLPRRDVAAQKQVELHTLLCACQLQRRCGRGRTRKKRPTLLKSVFALRSPPGLSLLCRGPWHGRGCSGLRVLGHSEGCGQRPPVRRCGAARVGQQSEEDREVAAPVISLGNHQIKGPARHRADQRKANTPAGGRWQAAAKRSRPQLSLRSKMHCSHPSGFRGL